MNSDDNGRLNDTHQIGGCRVLYNTARQTNAKHRKLFVRVQGQGADAVCLSDKVVTCDVDTTCQLGWCLPHPCSTAQPSAARRGGQAHHSQKQPPPLVTIKTLSLTTRSLVTSGRLETDRARRLSTDLRFVRHVRHNKCFREC